MPYINQSINQAINQAIHKTQIGGDHYMNMAVQPWNVVDGWPLEQQIGFHRGNVLKYLMRMEDKDDRLTNLKKAQHYLTKLISAIERAQP